MKREKTHTTLFDNQIKEDEQLLSALAGAIKSQKSYLRTFIATFKTKKSEQRTVIANLELKLKEARRTYNKMSLKDEQKPALNIYNHMIKSRSKLRQHLAKMIKKKSSYNSISRAYTKTHIGKVFEEIECEAKNI